MKTLKEKYSMARKGLQEKFSVKNVMAIPQITKVVVNCGIGKIAKEKDAMEEIFKNIKEITAQSPVYAKAKKSISGFKSREGQEVGIVVTLRGERMWSFLERLVSVALPRIRDFQGIDPNNFDSHGNLNLALREQIVFPEISPEHVKNIFGFQITVVTTAKNKQEGAALLKVIGFPIRGE